MPTCGVDVTSSEESTSGGGDVETRVTAEGWSPPAMLKELRQRYYDDVAVRRDRKATDVTPATCQRRFSAGLCRTLDGTSSVT